MSVVLLQWVRMSLLGWLIQRGVKPPQQTTQRKKVESSYVSPAPQATAGLHLPVLCWVMPTIPTRPTSQTAERAPPQAQLWVTASVMHNTNSSLFRLVYTSALRQHFTFRRCRGPFYSSVSGLTHVVQFSAEMMGWCFLESKFTEQPRTILHFRFLRCLPML